MNLSSVFGLLTALVGLTTTIHGGYKYISSPERTSKERIASIAIVSVIGCAVLGVGFVVQQATANTAVGKQPVPLVPTPAPTQAPAAPQAAPTDAPTTQPTLEPSPEPTVAPSPTPSPTPDTINSPTPSPTQPAPAITPTAPAP